MMKQTQRILSSFHNQSGTIRTRITNLLQCKHPIILPGMSWISTPPLVAAVSNAGGCGILATGPLTPSETHSSIQQIRASLNCEKNPFGVGITLLMPGSYGNLEMAVEEQVPVINISLGKPPREIVDQIHSYGGKIISTVTQVRHAEQALHAGADCLMITGHEAAAHGGSVGSLVLIPSFVQQFPSTPIIAAGGFATGSGLLAALSLGADGVAMGTRLAITKESPLHSHVKDTLTHPNQTVFDTVYGKKFDGIPARVLSTPIALQKMLKSPNLPTVLYRAIHAAGKMNIPLWKVIPGLIQQWDKMYTIAQFGAATQALESATLHGDLDADGVQFVGQCMGLIQDQPNVHDLIQQIIHDAIKRHGTNQALMSTSTL